MSRGDYAHHILVIDGANLTKKNVESINRLSSMFSEMGGLVVVFEAIKPNATLSAMNRIKRYGVVFDDIIQKQEHDPGLFDRRFTEFCVKTKRQTNDVTILCGSVMELIILSDKGVQGFMYG